MVFAGTQATPDGGLEASTSSTQHWWRRLRTALEADEGVGAHVRALLVGPAVRLSVVSARVDGAWVGTSDAEAWARLSSLLYHNHTSNRGWQGPEMKGALTLEVPAGTTVAVVPLGPSGAVVLREVEAEVVLVGGGTGTVAVERHTGDVTLWETTVDRIAGLRGTLRCRCTAAGFASWDDGVGKRGPLPRQWIAGLEGAAEIEVGAADLRLEAPRARLSVVNRFGDTELRVGPVAAASGDIRSGPGTSGSPWRTACGPRCST